MSSLRVLLFLFFMNLKIYDASDFTVTNFLKDPESIVSSDGTFRLAFFSPLNTTNRYVGIYYSKLPMTKVVWVANRNNPLTNSSGSFRISKDGNLQVLNGQEHILWSSKVTTNLYKAQLLVLFGTNDNMQWQSFDHPVNTILPQMSLMYNKDNDRNSMIQAWKSPSDPSQGRLITGLGPSVLPEFFIWDKGHRYYQTGPWNGNTFLGIEVKVPDSLSHEISIQTDGQDNSTLLFPKPPFPLSNNKLLCQGSARQQYWDDAKDNWIILRQAPGNECGIYRMCVEYGGCNLQNTPICECLNGFEPNIRREWSKGNPSSGHTRTRHLLCGLQGSKEDRFSSLAMMKPPADTNWLKGLDQETCRSQCLSNHSCLAYAFDIGLGCYTQMLSFRGIYVRKRLEHLEPGKYVAKFTLVP